MHRLLLVLCALGLLAVPVAAAEADLSWLAPPTAVSVSCGRTIFDLAQVEPIDPIPHHGEPVNTSDPNCICPSPVGLGWKMLNDTCKYNPATTFCTGYCFWDNPRLMIGTRTPCGSP